jgi:hypothetical protein
MTSEALVLRWSAWASSVFLHLAECFGHQGAQCSGRFLGTLLREVFLLAC